MAKKYDLAVKVGEYQKNGETKGRYENIGAVMQGDNGFYMILKKTFNPAGVPDARGGDSIIVSMFEPRQDGQQQNQGQHGGQGGGSQGGGQGGGQPNNDFSDEIPF